MRIKIKKGIFKFGLSAVLIFYAVSGAFQIHRAVNSNVSLIKNMINEVGTSTVVLNNIMENINKLNRNQGKPKTGSSERKDRPPLRTVQFVFLIMGAVLFSNYLNIILFILMAVIIFGSRIKKNILKEKRTWKPPEGAYYKQRTLRFITPAEKVLMSRADEYDIDHLNTNKVVVKAAGGKTPHFEFRFEERGFLMDISKKLLMIFKDLKNIMISGKNIKLIVIQISFVLLLVMQNAFSYDYAGEFKRKIPENYAPGFSAPTIQIERDEPKQDYVNEKEIGKDEKQEKTGQQVGEWLKEYMDAGPGKQREMLSVLGLDMKDMPVIELVRSGVDIFLEVFNQTEQVVSCTYESLRF